MNNTGVSQYLVEQNHRYSFSLRQCNKAISCLLTNLASAKSSHGSHMLATLVTCVLFVSFAFLQGDTQTAGRHLRYGAKLCREWQFGHSKIEPFGGSALTAVFSHLELNWSSVIEPDLTIVQPEDSVIHCLAIGSPAWCRPIHSLEEACNLLVGLGWLVCENNPQKPNKAAANKIFEKHQDAILRKLQSWKTELDYSLGHGVVLSTASRDTLAILELWSEVIYIRVATDSRSGEGETKFDYFRSNFQRAVHIATALLATHAGQISTPIFSVGMGIIPPLFLCTFRCRDWHIRRKALLLLRKYRRQEGIWTSHGTALVLERLVDIESEGLTPTDVVPEYMRINAMHFNVLPDDDLYTQLWYRRSQCRSLNESYTGCNIWETEILRSR
ncbi:hypothetical protein BDV29DRAFT_179805 [Aspergillus leporis]|uniref:Uncharacterized protein n=1 Tax=Aspergillus leporis TaxID=41062 RepID=A0A5N5WTR7_9EURO|nr:hypothetical protein BDV29DRAFT_179805 [Aspergillus leporis]